MIFRRSGVYFTVLAFAGVSTLAAAQTPQPMSAAEVAKVIDAARAARSSGQAFEALNMVAAILKRDPANSAAAGFTIQTMVEQRRVDDALLTYDAYVAARKRPDAPLLAVIGRADLDRIWQTRSEQPMLVADALERLARDGDPAALAALKQASSSSQGVSPEALAPLISLARIKDGEGIAKLAQLLGNPTPELKAQVIQAIGAADVRSLNPQLIAALDDASPMVRNAAAVALGQLQAKEAVPRLQTAFDNDAPAVKMFAAVALKQLGSSSADTFLSGLLNGQIAELRVIAAGAYKTATSRTVEWNRAVRELLASPNEQHRLQAAEMLACCDAAAARTSLISALASPNPLLRRGAAKILESKRELGDAAVARRILGDTLDPIRIYGAGLAMLYAKDPATPARGRGGVLTSVSR